MPSRIEDKPSQCNREVDDDPPASDPLDRWHDGRPQVESIRHTLAHVVDLRSLVDGSGPYTQALPPQDIDRASAPSVAAHPDATVEHVPVNPTVDVPAQTALTAAEDTPPTQPPHHADATHELVPGGPTLLRDRVALLEIARYRLLSFRQLHQHVFTNLHKTVVTRRMQALTEAGFITTWEERLAVGGRPRYALPTRRGLEWALEEFKAEAKALPHERLVRLMIGETGKRPLELAPRTAPPFLPHQDETNRVVAALVAQPHLSVTWASTWHRPFPNAIDGLRMPQPDAVLVATREGHPHLVFLEHDRGQEAPASFARKKAERYYELSLYGMARELFAFDDFTVWVTVNDVAGRKPLQRIRTLQAVSRNAGMMRFTLAGWIPVHGHRMPIWFTPATPIETRAHHPDAHEARVGAFASTLEAQQNPALTELLRRVWSVTGDLGPSSDAAETHTRSDSAILRGGAPRTHRLLDASHEQA